MNSFFYQFNYKLDFYFRGLSPTDYTMVLLLLHVSAENQSHLQEDTNVKDMYSVVHKLYKL